MIFSSRYVAPITEMFGIPAERCVTFNGSKGMRVRALGVTMLVFGLAGALASFGLWWMLYRYGESIGDAAGVRVPCIQHCGGVDGAFLTGLIASACVAVIGSCITVMSILRRSRPPLS
jgi:hypothetical protein